jgi:hypothetical protein
MPHEKREKARIALLIVVAVLAIAGAMLEALADNSPSSATPAPSRLAPSTLPPTLTPPETPADESTYPRMSARARPSSFERGGTRGQARDES